MADFNFSQPERRGYLLPIGIVLAIAAAVFGLMHWLMPYRTPQLSVTQVSVLPTHTIFPGHSIKVGAQDQAEDNLYVLARVKVTDTLKLPIFIKDLTGTLTTNDGAQETESAAEKNDLESLYESFPKLRQMASTPLLRETEIKPGESAEGMVLLHFSVPQSVWDGRSGAVVTVDTYHQGPLTVALPK